MSAVAAMSIGFRRSATQDLTHVGLAVTPRRRQSRWLVASVLLLAASVGGAGVGYAIRDRAVAPERPALAAPSAEMQALRQQLEQARLGARLSDARSRELERQIDALNQRLAASNDELAFFRKAREGKH